MERFKTSRRTGNGSSGSLLLLAVCLVLCPWASAASFPRHAQQQYPAPIERRPAPPSRMPGGGIAANPYGYVQRQQPAPVERRAPGRGEHLAEWMNQHRNLTPEQQQQALGREPGFSSLPPQTQQRYRERLAQLNAMNPVKRQRELAHIEAMERLTLPQRAEVRSAMGQLGSLPLDQRMVVAREFRALRDLPAGQRIPAMNSGRFGPPLNDVQRATLYHLLQVEPLLYPANQPAAAVPQPMMPMQPPQ